MFNSGSERRGAPRFAVIMEAQATDLRTNATFKLRCSDISLTGCYLDTLNPAEAGAPVRIRLEHGRRVFECQAKVAYKVQQMGMGVAFAHPLPGEQLETVSAWLSEAAAVPGSQG
jgi:PilZ domain